MATTTPTMTEDIAAADKEMEERANRAKDLLSQRYLGLRSQQVRTRELEEARTKKRELRHQTPLNGLLYCFVLHCCNDNNRRLDTLERWN